MVSYIVIAQKYLCISLFLYKSVKLYNEIFKNLGCLPIFTILLQLSVSGHKGPNESVNYESVLIKNTN
jgi:hypothetical protein